VHVVDVLGPECALHDQTLSLGTTSISTSRGTDHRARGEDAQPDDLARDPARRFAGAGRVARGAQLLLEVEDFGGAVLQLVDGVCL